MNTLLRSICVLLIGVGIQQIEAKGNLYIAVPKGVKYDFDVKFNLKNRKGEFDGSKAIVLKKESDEPVFIGNLSLIDTNSFYFGTVAEYKAYIYKKLKDTIVAAAKDASKYPDRDYDYLVTIKSVGGFLTSSWTSDNGWTTDKGEPAYQAILFNGTEWHLEINFNQTIKDSEDKKIIATKHSQLFLNKKDKKKTNQKWFGDIETIDKVTLQGKWSEAKTWASKITSALNSTTIDITKEFKAAAKKIEDIEIQTVAITVEHVQHVTGLGKMVGRGWKVNAEVISRTEDMKAFAKTITVERLPHGGIKKLD